MTPTAIRPSDPALGNELPELRALSFPEDVTAKQIHSLVVELCDTHSIVLIERETGIQGISDIYELVLPPLKDAIDKHPHGFSLVVMVTRPHLGASVSLTMHGAHHVRLPAPDEVEPAPLDSSAQIRLRHQLWQPLARLA